MRIEFIKYWIFIFFSISGCSTITIDSNKLLDKLEDKVKGESIELNYLFQVDADRYYLFYEYADNKLISEVTGVPFVGLKEVKSNHTRIIGVKENDVLVSLDIDKDKSYILFGVKNNHDPLYTNKTICIIQKEDKGIPFYILGHNCDQ